MITAGAILFALVLATDVVTDYRKWLQRKPVKHKKEGLIRILFLMPSGVALFWPFITSPLQYWYMYFVIIAMIFFNYWNLFDGFYNMVRRYGWFFTGTEDADDAATDNFLQRQPLWVHVALKIGGSVVTIFIYIKIILWLQ